MSFRRIATIGLASGAALAAVTALAVSASGSAAPAAPAAPAGKVGGHVMVFTAVTSQETEDDQGKKGFSAGDRFTFADDLYAWGTKKKVGTDGGDCVVTWMKGDEASLQCVATLTLKGGQITVQGTSTGSEGTAPFTVAVTGGTGMYRGATGVLTVDEGEKSDKLTLRLDRGTWSEGMGGGWAPWDGEDAGGGAGGAGGTAG